MKIFTEKWTTYLFWPVPVLNQELGWMFPILGSFILGGTSNLVHPDHQPETLFRFNFWSGCFLYECSCSVSSHFQINKIREMRVQKKQWGFQLVYCNAVCTVVPEPSDPCFCYEKLKIVIIIKINIISNEKTRLVWSSSNSAKVCFSSFTLLFSGFW